jgi:Protein of unknown function (DUF3429)
MILAKHSNAGQRPSQWALLLGYAGLIPFVTLAFAVWWLDPAWRTKCVFALLAYSATILSFLGAIHWGLTMRDASPSIGLLAWGVMPSLIAWIALLVPASVGLWLVSIALWLCFAVDRRIYPKFGLQSWLGMRLRLTAVASICCSAVALALNSSFNSL